MYIRSVIIFKMDTDRATLLFLFLSLCIDIQHLNAHTHFSSFFFLIRRWPQCMSCSPHRGAGHEIKLLLVISVQLLPPWPLVVCVPKRDIRPLSELALSACVCAWEGEMLRVRSTASDCFIFFLNWVLLQGQLLSVTTARPKHTYTALPTGAATEHAQSAATPPSTWANRKWQHNALRVPTGSRVHTQREWGMKGWLISKVGM